MGSCCQGAAVRQDIDIDIDFSLPFSRLPRKCSADDDLRLARRREDETLRALARETEQKGRGRGRGETNMVILLCMRHSVLRGLGI